MTSKGLRSLAAIGIGLTMAAAAYAGQISDPVISINWSSGDVGGSFTVPYDASLYNAETGWYRWALSEPVDLTSGDVTYATVNQLSTQINVDPQISLNFAVTAGAAPVNADLVGVADLRRDQQRLDHRQRPDGHHRQQR